MKRIISICCGILMVACNWSTEHVDNVQVIHQPAKQDRLFKSLITVTGNAIPAHQLQDSLAFLVLPLHVSCPSCRDKVIDSIIQYRQKIPSRHFIIISAKSGRKTINSFFRDKGSRLPNLAGTLFIDSMDKAGELGLYDEKPTMYYTHDKKAYEVVSSIPLTVKEDLHHFFSGSGTK
jgi:hypothetical protein